MGRPEAMAPTPSFTCERASFRPAYVDTFASGALARKVAAAEAALAACRLCPRGCAVNRTAGEAGVCRTGRHPWVSSAFPHMGEEDCLRGWNGSGTVFFTGCNLRCSFCQNFDISWEVSGREMGAAEIAELMLGLQGRGCHNINFVTPAHVVPQLLAAVLEAVPRGLALPIVYNTSGYDSLGALELLDGVVDIYMPDFKFWDPAVAQRLTLAQDYPVRAREALREMHRQVGDLTFDESGLALRGLLVRHLVLPHDLAGTRQVMRFLAREISPHTYVNLMAQYHPAGLVPLQPERFGDLQRSLHGDEHRQAVQAAREEGLYRFDDRRRLAVLW